MRIIYVYTCIVEFFNKLYKMQKYQRFLYKAPLSLSLSLSHTHTHTMIENDPTYFNTLAFVHELSRKQYVLASTFPILLWIKHCAI